MVLTLTNISNLKNSRCHFNSSNLITHYTSTHNRLMALFPGLPGWAGNRNVKPIWILLKQETVSGNGISWATCKSAPRSRQITTLAPHHLVYYRPDALPATQPTASKHRRKLIIINLSKDIINYCRDLTLCCKILCKLCDAGFGAL